MRLFSSLICLFFLLLGSAWANLLEQSKGCWVSTSIQHSEEFGHYSAVLDLRDGFKIGTLFLSDSEANLPPRVLFPAEGTRDIRVIELIEKANYAIAQCEVDPENQFVLHLTKQSISLFDEFGQLQAVFLKKNISSSDFAQEFEERIQATEEMKPHFRDSWEADLVFYQP